MKGRRPRPLDDGGLVDRTGSLFIPSFEPPLVYARFKRVRKSFCSILGTFEVKMQVFMPYDTIIPTGQNELSGYQKNFKFSSKTPLECTFEVADPLPIPQTTLELPPALHKEVGVALPPTSPEPDPEKMCSPVANPRRGQREEPRKARERSRRELAQTQNPHRPHRPHPAQSRAPDAAERPPPIFPYLRGEPGLLLFFLTFTKNALCAY